MVNYPTQLDEIDQWLADNFGIMPGACSSTENLRYNTARTIAEALWPKCKDSLHIQETCKENGDSFTDDIDGERDQVEGPSRDQVDKLEKAAKTYAENRSYLAERPSGEIVEVYNIAAEEGFKDGANWQREQDHYACRQCEKNYDNVFFKGEQNAIKMMKEEAIEASCFGGKEGEEHIVTFVVPYFRVKDHYTLGDKARLYIFKN